MSKTTADQESREASILTGGGFRYEIKYTATEYGRGLRGLFRGPQKTERTETLTFREPTLAVLDLVTDIYLRMRITDPQPGASASDTIHCANKTAHDNTRLMAEVVAVFALGEQSFIREGFTYHRDERAITRLRDLILHTTTPGQMEKLISLCTALGNLPGFLNSIRLTGASRTTTPANLVE